MLRLKVLLVAMGLWLAMGSMPLSAQGAYEIPTIAKLEQGCSAGNAADCDELGMRHLRGDGTAEDPKKATSYFQRACDRGDARGCFNLGDSYQFGDGVPKDPAKAAAFYLRACDGREKRGCSELALSYLSGNGVERSEAKAALYADRSCTLNSPFGCAILGMAYADGVEGYPQDLAKAKDLLSDACHQKVDYTKKPDEAARLACPALAKVTGEPACFTMNWAAADASGVRIERHCFDAEAGWVTTVTQKAAPPAAAAAPPAPPPASTALNAGNAAYARKDYATAAVQFAKACDAGAVEACGSLGEMYATGQGVKANGKLAAPTLAKACDGGIAKACGTLGTLFDAGNGVSNNKERAFALFGSACAKSDMTACYHQGRLYESGAGVGGGRNLELAAANYQKSCDAGIADACAGLGNMYQTGVYFSQNDGKALSFFRLACTKSGSSGCREASSTQAKIERKAELEFATAAATMTSRAVNSPSCAKANQQDDDDLVVAEQYARQGIKLNDPYCMHMMGWVYENKQDYELAYRYYMAAANKGLASSIHNIGGFYHNGYYVETDYKEAIRWYQRSIDAARASGDTDLITLAEENIASSEEAMKPRSVYQSGPRCREVGVNPGGADSTLVFQTICD